MKHEQKKTQREVKYICDFCDYETISEINLKNHEKDVHMRTKTKPSTDKSRREFVSNNTDKRKSNVQEANFSCDVCDFTAMSDRELNGHLERVHRFKRVNRQGTGYSQEERRNNGLCFHWNNGNCRFQESCKFAHDEIPQCQFDGRCTRNNCHFFHTKQKNEDSPPFLYRRGLQNNPVHNQRRHLGGGQRR